MIAVLVCALAGCALPQPPGLGSPSGGGGAREVKPDACGPIHTNDTGRKLYAFFRATVELQRQAGELSQTTRKACVDMAGELALPADATSGDTATICRNVSDALRAHLQGGLKGEAQFRVKYQPAICTVNVDAAAEVSAACEGKARADVVAVCEGTCQGTCQGECAGTCQAKNAQGQCAGACEGTCRGGCSGSCVGSADVQAEASCEAAAEVHANVESRCTEPKLEVTYDDTLVVDGEKVERARRAVMKGLPTLLMASAKAQGPVSRAFLSWGKATRELYGSADRLGQDMGAQAVCVTGQLGAAFQAIAQIEVEVSVTVEASASVGGACGASAG
jgi:hypothetical protein